MYVCADKSEDESGRSRWVRACGQNRCKWSHFERRRQHQSLAHDARQCNKCLSRGRNKEGRTEEGHPLQKFQAHQIAAGIAWRKRRHRHGIYLPVDLIIFLILSMSQIASISPADYNYLETGIYLVYM